MLDLSVIIPSYNEEFRILSTLNSVHDCLTQAVPNFEIIAVNDGSKDGTSQVVEEFAKHHERVRLISYPMNKGKGFAVKTGVLAANGELVLMNDADGSSPIEECLRLNEAIQKGADIAIGSRAKPDPTRVVKALSYRTHMGNTFNSIVQSLLLPGIYDTQCGFKLFKRQVAREIFSLARINGYGFDVEILYIARQRNYVIAEVPINWSNVDGSKVNIMIDPAKMLFEIMKIKINALTGHYRENPTIKVHD
jgi:dolichyl-phosphate beta-glucosyltransferase